VDECYAAYEPTKAARALTEFVTEYLSNWYVRLSRRRFRKGKYSENKIAAKQTLYTFLRTVTIIMCPEYTVFYSKNFFDFKNPGGRVPFTCFGLIFFLEAGVFVCVTREFLTHLADLAFVLTDGYLFLHRCGAVGCLRAQQCHADCRRADCRRRKPLRSRSPADCRQHDKQHEWMDAVQAVRTKVE